MKTRFFFGWIIVLALCCADRASAAGLILVKDQPWFGPDKAAPVEYKTISKFAAVWNVVDLQGGKRSYRRELLVDDVEVPSDGDFLNITTPDQVELLRSRVETIRAFSKKYPQARPRLQSCLDLLEGLNARTASEVRVNGKWMTKAAYADESTRVAAEARRDVWEKTVEGADKRRAEFGQTIEGLKDEIRSLEGKREAALAVLKVTPETAMPGSVKIKRFQLRRKLPETNFEALYRLGRSVYEVSGEGGAAAVLVSDYIDNAEEGYVSVYTVTQVEGVSVTIRNGREERVSVFRDERTPEIENARRAASARESAQAEIEQANTQLEKAQKALKELQSNSVEL